MYIGRATRIVPPLPCHVVMFILIKNVDVASEHPCLLHLVIICTFELIARSPSCATTFALTCVRDREETSERRRSEQDKMCLQRKNNEQVIFMLDLEGFNCEHCFGIFLYKNHC